MVRRNPAGHLADALHAYSRTASPNELGALKRYKIPPGDDSKQAHARFAREVEVLRATSHPNLMRLIDADLAANWMITQYYEGKPLQENKEQFRGRPLESLTAFRGLVEGVANLHEAGAVHRDIKPPNIFVDHGQLVLGDFGIIFMEEERTHRITETFERVGTRDWMPPWAHTGMRVDDVGASFDVFCLGKVLWSMLSGKDMLPLWYFARPAYDLQAQFPNVPAMKSINERILAACVVEDEHDCVGNAGLLLELVDEVIDTLRRGRQEVGREMRCQFCVDGRYTLLWEKLGTPTRLLLLPPEPAPDHRLMEHQISDSKNYVSVRAYRCDKCGNVATFHFPDGSPMPAWEKVAPLVNIKRV